MSEYSPFETLKPANSIVASLGIGMQALSSSIRTKTPGRPRSADDVDREVDDRVGDGGDDEGEHAAAGYRWPRRGRCRAARRP